MEALIHQLSAWSASWGEVMWQACWQGGIAIGLVWGICQVFPRISGRTRCWLWRLAVAKLLIACFWLTPVRLAWLPAEPTPVLPEVIAPVEFTATAINVAPVVEPEPAKLGAAAWILSLWSAGVVWMIWRLWRRRLESGQLRASCRPLRNEDFGDQLQEVCERIGLRRAPELLESDHIGTPLLVGARRPAVILPAGREYSREEMRMILAHELSHIRRHDLWWIWLMVAAQVIFFFHPLVWLARRENEAAQEAACDELGVLAVDASPAEFGDMLLRIAASGASDHGDGLLAAGVVRSQKTLKRRLVAMKHIKPVSRWRIAAAVSIITVFTVAGIVPWQLVAAESQAPKNPKPKPSPESNEANNLLRSNSNSALQSLASGNPMITQVVANSLLAQAPKEPQRVNVSTPVGGLVKGIKVRAGDRVKSGQVLVELDDRKARAQMETAEARYRAGRAAYELKRIETEFDILQAQEAMKLVEKGLMSKTEGIKRLKVAEVQLEKAKADYVVIEAEYREAHVDLALLTIRSPVDGVVVGVNAHQGDYLKFPPEKPTVQLAVYPTATKKPKAKNPKRAQDPSASRAR